MKTALFALAILSVSCQPAPIVAPTQRQPLALEATDKDFEPWQSHGDGCAWKIIKVEGREYLVVKSGNGVAVTPHHSAQP